MRYAIVGKYMSKNEITGFGMAEVSNGMLSTHIEHVTRDRIIYHGARGELVNFRVIVAGNSVRLLGSNCTLESLPVLEEIPKQVKENSMKEPLIKSRPQSYKRICQDRININVQKNTVLDTAEEIAIKTLMYNIVKLLNEMGIFLQEVTIENQKGEIERNSINPLVIRLNMRRNQGFICLELKSDLRSYKNEIQYAVVGNSFYNGGIKKMRVNWIGLKTNDKRLQLDLKELIDTVDQMLFISDRAKAQ